MSTYPEMRTDYRVPSSRQGRWDFQGPLPSETVKETAEKMDKIKQEELEPGAVPPGFTPEGWARHQRAFEAYVRPPNAPPEPPLDFLGPGNAPPYKPPLGDYTPIKPPSGGSPPNKPPTKYNFKDVILQEKSTFEKITDFIIGLMMWIADQVSIVVRGIDSWMMSGL